jgi:hypothetical protein
MHKAEVLKVAFSTLSSDEVEKLSVVEVTEDRLYAGGAPRANGNSRLR